MNQIGSNWQDKYWDLMIKENYDEAIPLKLSNFPKSFYKYKTLSESTIDCIEQNYIWLADISKLNDPFECSIQFDNDECLREFYGSNEFQTFFKDVTGQTLTSQEVTSLTMSENPFNEYVKICRTRNIPYNQTPEQQLKKVQNRWTEIVDEVNQNLRICSYSLSKSSLLLWSHYADEHKGICIEYDFANEDIIRAFIQPVIYRNNIHKIKLFEEYTTPQMIGASLIKSIDWQYEQEWRLTIFKQKDEFSQKIQAPTPKAILLGTRFYSNEDSLKQKLYKILKDKNIPIFQMVKDPTEFKLIESEYIVTNTN